MALELWQPDFDFYLAHAEDQLLSIFVDLGALESAPVRSHPRCVHVRVRMQNPLPNGLRAREEMDALLRLEDAIRAELTSVDAVYVGRVVTSGLTDLVFYAGENALTEPNALLERIASLLGSYQGEVDAEADPEWAFYDEFLYPDAYNLQFIWNRRLVLQATESGDVLHAERPIDHVVLFDDDGPARQAAESLSQSGFGITGIDANEDGTWAVEFTRADVLADNRMDEVLTEVLDIILPLGGEYDGWNADVVTLSG